MHSLGFYVFAIMALWIGLPLGLPYALENVDSIKSPAIEPVRSTETCADPSLAEIIFESFRPDWTIHVLSHRWAYEDSNTRSKAIVWGDIHPEFRAWPTQQNFTVPLFQMASTDGTQYIYRLGMDAQTPPVVSGFPTAGVLAWVYDSQVCGSVPLMSAGLASFTDHYYATSAFEHDRLVSAAGWADTGVVAYVLPVYNF